MNVDALQTDIERPLTKVPHPIIWLILYLPFGALSGFVLIPLTYLATKNGLSISEGALLNGAQLVSQWLKWIWAPLVDITLTPRRWYIISTTLSALGIFAMTVVPLSPSTLMLLLAIIAIAGLVNSAVGMAVEATIAGCIPKDQVGRVSGWFQAGNLGGNGLGGGLGLYLLTSPSALRILPKPWMTGAVMSALFMACCLALLATPEVIDHHHGQKPAAAVLGVVRDLRLMLKTKGGLFAAILCIVPVSTGAAQGVLTQAAVADYWGASAGQVAFVQGLLAGCITMVGCFAGGWLCDRFAPRTAYLGIGILLGIVATVMAFGPATGTSYVAFNCIYSFAVGLAYAAFSAVVFSSIGPGSGATKYNVFASLSNFPLWWLGLLLAWVAQKWGAPNMLLAEAALGVVGVAIFAVSARAVARSRLPD